MLRNSFSSFFSRHLALRSGDGARRSPAIVVAIGGVALSVAVMMIAIAVTSGFKKEIAEKIEGFEAQLRIVPVSGPADSSDAGVVPVDCSGRLLSVIESTLERYADGKHLEIAPVATCAGLLKTPDNFAGVMFKAYGDGAGMRFEISNLIEGALPADSINPRGIMISETTAKALQLEVGSRINAYFFVGNGVRPRRYDVTGIYNSGFGDFDRVVAYMPKTAIDNLLHLDPAQGEAIEVRGLEPTEIVAAASALQGALNGAFSTGEITALYNVADVYTSGAAYFNWLAMLDTNIVVVLVLMGCVSGFMLVSCLLILILQRVRMIGLLKAMGATDGQIKAVFLRLGLRVVIVGLTIGNALALALLASEAMWHWMPLDPESYYLSCVPVNLTVTAWAALNVSAALGALLLMLVPATLVSHLQVAKTMRWE